MGQGRQKVAHLSYPPPYIQHVWHWQGDLQGEECKGASFELTILISQMLLKVLWSLCHVGGIYLLEMLFKMLCYVMYFKDQLTTVLHLKIFSFL